VQRGRTPQPHPQARKSLRRALNPRALNPQPLGSSSCAPTSGAWWQWNLCFSALPVWPSLVISVFLTSQPRQPSSKQAFSLPGDPQISLRRLA
jgi:hypothetical protein